MRITVHRGTHQIGGCAVEIRTASARILIDFGMELAEDGEADELEIEGLTHGVIDFDAVFFTHYHGDHIGLLDRISPSVPLYLGETACEIFAAYAKRVGRAGASARLLPLKALVPIEVGGIKVTPIPADHSAYDALMYLIEAEGRRILHTGDFRLHGFCGKATLPLLKQYASPIDLLIIEGTRLAQARHSGLSEEELQTELRRLIRQHKHVFMLCASTNIDRLAVLHNATPRGRYFVCDRYQRQILQTVASRSESRWYRFKKALEIGSNLKLRERGFVMPVRANDDFAAIAEEYPEAVLIYSMWEGYLDGRSPAIGKFAEPFRAGGRFYALHTSGHAPSADLEKVCQITSPGVGIIPIHTEENGQSDLFGSKRIRLQDGEAFVL